MITIKLNKNQLKELNELKEGETLESTYKGLDCYIERVETENTSNLKINNKYFAFNFFFPSVVVANPQTVNEFLKSKQFKKEYKCWGYSFRFYNQYGEEWNQEKYNNLTDEEYNKLIGAKIVIKTEQGWELGDDHEMYAFCKIFIEE